ncbi:hypothetical protein IscW_ISCW002603 [Ixodes scapularis]|uniref:Uncharacterized protein n=1 Tax=Ixodes scapularis TaxID=6945 RepID=B7PCJ2_IXOSC|nr:hypothetical protein IscW_ISCW002603 [Ixodes scapularis]|eukprot:XP_002409920.1 hypothetical protein IscW_ISCW002603 [Ixodes scapularis]
MTCDVLTGWTAMPVCADIPKCVVKAVVPVPTVVRFDNGTSKHLENIRPVTLYKDGRQLQVFDPVTRVNVTLKCVGHDMLEPQSNTSNYFDALRVSQTSPGPVDVDVMAVANASEHIRYFVSSASVNSTRIGSNDGGHVATVHRMRNEKTYRVVCYSKSNDLDSSLNKTKCYVVYDLRRLVTPLCGDVDKVWQDTCKSDTSADGRNPTARYAAQCVPCGGFLDNVKQVLDTLQSFGRNETYKNTNIYDRLCVREKTIERERKTNTMIYVVAVVCFVLALVFGIVLVFTLCRSSRNIQQNKKVKKAQKPKLQLSSNLPIRKAYDAIRNNETMPLAALVQNKQ